jgi:hypothetical protein
MANYPVTNFDDLVSAISTANDGDTIIFNNTGTLTLSAALPAINKSLTFTSAGRNTTISGGGKYRVFTVNDGNVTFTNLTIASGLATDNGTPTPAGLNGADAWGGGLLVNGGNVTLINTVFQGNAALGGAGQANPGGQGGSGGNGLGGAVFVNSGFLRISNSSFLSNAAIGGAGGVGNTGNGQAGTSAGGAVYNFGGTVLAEGAPRTDSKNTSADNKEISGTGAYQQVAPPLVQSINRADPDPTAAATVTYIVQFDQNVSGVDESDFAIKKTGTITGEGVISATPVGTSFNTYQVQVNAGIGNGTIELDLKDNDSIRIPTTIPNVTIPLGGSGLGNGDLPGQTYTVNRTPPTATISYFNNAPSRTAANLVTYTVFFSEPVNGVDTNASAGFDDFTVVQAEGVSGASVVSVTPRSTDPSNQFYDVVVNTGNGNGTVALRLKDGSVTSRARGVALKGDVDGPAYTILKTPPSIASIERVGNSPTGDATVSFRVTFTQDVKGVDANDFAVAPAGGLKGANIVSVTPVETPNAAGVARTYTVVVNTGGGDGSLGLNAVDNDTITNELNVPLGGIGLGNGNAVGEAYSVIKSAPLVSSIALANSNPTASDSVSYVVTFNQDVNGVTKDDFRPSGYSSGLSNFAITNLTGSGRTYTVTVSTGTGSGILGLNLTDNDSIVNNVGAPLGGKGIGNGNFTGQVYTINKRPPRVAAITRLQSSSTNAGTVNFAVSFSEAVGNVDTSDFGLATQGLTGAAISSVTRVNDSFYSVAVNTGRGEGTIGLNLVDNDSISNGLGLPLGGVGANNGNFQGEAYTIDRTAPVADIVDVAPDPRQDKVDAITIRFSEAVKGFDISDLQLTRDGSLVSLSRATLTSADGITWTLGNLKRATSRRGTYGLLLVATGSGITDTASNPLLTNAVDQWTNLVSVQACDPGITRRGTNGANRLEGTEDSDALIGLAGNDTLIGLDCADRLDGGKGNDRLNGGLDGDVLIGGAGADRFIYSGINQADALENSLVDFPDRIQDFKFSQGDKIQLDFDSNLGSKNLPRKLFNAGKVKGQTLEQAAQNAYRSKNQDSRNPQKLGSNEAVFFGWRNSTYLSVNDSSAGFSATRDLVVNVSGIQFKSGDAGAGNLNVANYFA